MEVLWQKNGWLAKNIIGKRNIFFLVSGDQEFRLTFTFGDKAVKAIHAGNLPADIVKQVNEAKKYTEGRVLLISVKHQSDCKTVNQLIDIKIEN